jgi:hypothetical protein
LHIERTIDSFLQQALAKKVVGYTLLALDATFRWSPEHYYNLESVEEAKKRYSQVEKWRIEEIYEDDKVPNDQFLDRRKSS